MPLTSAKCPHCGAPLQVNPNAKQLVCRYCGNEFIVEDAIKNVEINIKDSQIKNDFNGATIYVQNGAVDKNDFSLTRELNLKFGGTLLFGGSWEFFVDGKSVCSINKGEWTIKISGNEHILQAKLYGEGTIQVTNILRVEPGNNAISVVIKNRVFGSPIIMFND